jgi:hypothetical protein
VVEKYENTKRKCEAFVRYLTTTPRMYRGSRGIIPRFLNLCCRKESGEEQGKWSATRSGRFIPNERAPVFHSVERQVGCGVGLDDLEE